MVRRASQESSHGRSAYSLSHCTAPPRKYCKEKKRENTKFDIKEGGGKFCSSGSGLGPVKSSFEHCNESSGCGKYEQFLSQLGDCQLSFSRALLH